MDSNQITDIIKTIAKEKRTGSLLCVDKDNKLGRLYFKEGRAITARYHQAQGREAYSRIIQLKPKSTRFHSGRDMVFSKLAILNDAQAAKAASVRDADRALDQTVDSPTTPAAARISGSAKPGALTPESRDLLRDELAKFIGPVAQIVVDSLNDKISMKDAIATLATEIGERSAAYKFINAMKQKADF